MTAQIDDPATETAVSVFEPHEAAEAAEAVEGVPLPTSSTADPYHGVAALPFDDRAQEVLAKYQTVADEWIDIKPNGQIYLSHMKLRYVFNHAFGFGGWGLVPVGDYKVEDAGNHVTVYREYRLYVAGRFVGQAIGAGDYWKNNAEQNYGDACESAQSYALNRLGKPFGIASQCWDKAYAEHWKARYAEQYTNPRNNKTEWRKKNITKSAAGRTEPVVPEERAEAPASAPASDGEMTAIIIPEKFEKILKWGGFVLDANGKTWTFPKEFLPIAESAINHGQTLAITYKSKYDTEKKKTYLNVTDAKAL